MSGIGHNGGPTLDEGRSWRAACWRRARAELLPALPIEVIRLRVRRAAEIGLDYRIYATVRATTGHDVVALLFSSNALRLLVAGAQLDPACATRLGPAPVARHLAAQPPLDPARALAGLRAQGAAFEGAGRAPAITLAHPALRAALRGLVPETPADRVLVIGDTALERDWTVAARFAGYVAADRFFA